jgi:hypothetical protein
LEQLGYHKRDLLVSRVQEARAIASLPGEFTSTETDIDALMREMHASILEADAFIKALEST